MSYSDQETRVEALVKLTDAICKLSNSDVGHSWAEYLAASINDEVNLIRSDQKIIADAKGIHRVEIKSEESLED